MIKKQIIAIVIASVLIVAAVVVYYAVVKPLVEENGSVVEETPETLEGEEIGSSNRFYMYSHLDRSEMASIEISNSSGTFKLVNNENNEFHVDGYPGIALDDTLVASLVATCGSPLSKLRVTANASAEKLEEYGLKDPSASWIITDKNGKQYKVYVGRKLLTGGGYYCAFAGRNSVYVLDTTLESTVLSPVENFVTPYIIFGIGESDFYTVDNFTVYRGKEKFISVGKVPVEEQNSPEALVENVLTYPAPYNPESEVYLNILLGYEAFKGDSTYKLGATAEDLAACGLDNPQYTVSFVYGGKTFYFLASEADEDNYYVVSGIYGDIISKISKKNLPYLEYDLLSWLSPYVFRRNITTISSVSVKSANVDETFHLVHSTDENGKARIQVRTDSGHELVTESDTLNFRHYYSDLISLALKDYLPEEASPGVPMEEFLADDANRTMTITCTTLNGFEYVFDIYRYSTRRCAISVNGRFDFCMLNDVVKLIESDTARLLAGEEVIGTY